MMAFLRGSADAQENCEHRGTRDAVITEEQRTEQSQADGDSGWDGVYTSEARITKKGVDRNGGHTH